MKYLIKYENKLLMVGPRPPFKSVNIGGGCPTDRNSQPPRYSVVDSCVNEFTLKLTNNNPMIGSA